MTAAALVERVSLRRISPVLGFADVRLEQVNLRSMRVEMRPDGRLTITPPQQQGRDGRSWPLYALQPGVREAIEQAIAVVWERTA